MLSHPLEEALTFDDVLLIPAKSSVHPRDCETRSFLTASIELAIPLISAAMDTVTEAFTAISMAQGGGLGIIHKNMSIEAQASQVLRVKKFESGMVSDPITISVHQLIQDAKERQEQTRITGFVVVDDSNKVVGILTNRDIRSERDVARPISAVMTPLERLVTVLENTSRQEAISLLHKHRIEKLPVLDNQGRLKGLVTIRDIERSELYPHATKDARGSLRVGAAVGVGGGGLSRAEALIKAGADVICVDTAHGHSQTVLDTVKQIRKAYPKLQIIAGNIATGQAAIDLATAGANAVKVGMGPGSICTTRIVSGVGVPQITAIDAVSSALKDSNVTVIADGGIKYSGHLVKAIAAGADTVMVGSLFAGTDESPGEVVLYQGRSYKVYRGMGSLGAMQQGSSDRYFQENVSSSKFVPEGIEGRVPYRGKLTEVIYQLMGGLRSGMGYVGVTSIPQLQRDAQFMKISSAGLKESHVHDVEIVKEAPNYGV